MLIRDGAFLSALDCHQAFSWIFRAGGGNHECIRWVRWEIVEGDQVGQIYICPTVSTLEVELDTEEDVTNTKEFVGREGCSID